MNEADADYLVKGAQMLIDKSEPVFLQVAGFVAHSAEAFYTEAKKFFPEDVALELTIAYVSGLARGNLVNISGS